MPMSDRTPDRATGFSAFLDAFDPETRSKLLRHGRRRHLAAGETLFLRGDPGDALYLIESGRIEISITALSGRRSVINHMRSGEILGEIALLDNANRSADATAATDCVVLGLSRTDISNFLDEQPGAALALVAELCSRVRDALQMYELQTHVSARARLSRCLLKVADKWGRTDKTGAVHILEPMSQSDLGEFSGMARENVNRTLKAFASEGLVTVDGRMIVIVAPEELAEIAEG